MRGLSCLIFCYRRTPTLLYLLAYRRTYLRNKNVQMGYCSSKITGGLPNSIWSTQYFLVYFQSKFRWSHIWTKGLYIYFYKKSFHRDFPTKTIYAIMRKITILGVLQAFPVKRVSSSLQTLKLELKTKEDTSWISGHRLILNGFKMKTVTNPCPIS